MHIGERETKWLLVILVTSRFFLGAVSGFVKAAGTAAAVSAAVCSLLVLLYFAVLGKIRLNSEGGISSMLSMGCGKYLGFAAAALLTVFSVFNASARLREFTNAVGDIILPDSPDAYIIIFFAAVMLAVSFFGTETITRYCLAAGTVILLLAALICLMNISSADLLNVCPPLGNGISGILKGLGSVYLFSDMLYIYLLEDFFRKKGASGRIGVRAAAVSGVVITVLTLMYTLCVPYPASKFFEYPVFRLAALSNTSVLFQRADGIVYIIWLFSGFISSGALALFTAMLFAKCFRADDYRGCVPAVIFIICALALSKTDLSRFGAVFAAASFIIVGVAAAVQSFREKNRGGKNAR